MTGDQIIHVVAMWNGLMPAIRAMNVTLLAMMLGCATLRIGGAHLNPVLVYAIAAYVVQMPIVKVIGMTVVSYGRVPATWTVCVGVALVSCVCFRHEISFPLHASNGRCGCPLSCFIKSGYRHLRSTKSLLSARRRSHNSRFPWPSRAATRGSGYRTLPGAWNTARGEPVLAMHVSRSGKSRWPLALTADQTLGARRVAYGYSQAAVFVWLSLLRRAKTYRRRRRWSASTEIRELRRCWSRRSLRSRRGH
jgi:hypothetical protein